MEVESKSIVDTAALEVDSLVEIYLSSLGVGNRSVCQLKTDVPEDKSKLDGRPAAQSPLPIHASAVLTIHASAVLPTHAAVILPTHAAAILPDTAISVSDTPSKAISTSPLKDKHGDIDDWDGVDERDCYITMKVVPDTFSLPNEQQPPPPDGRGGVHNRTMMHFYKVVVQYKDDRLFAVGGSTSELLYGSMKALNDIGLAFRRQLSDDLLENGYNLFIMDVVLEMRILYMGEYAVSTPVMTQMQRFHKAVMSQEDTTECSDTSMQDRYFPLAFDFSCNGSSVEWPVADEDWCRSGNGSHYVVFPFKGGCYDTVGVGMDDDAVFDLVYLTRCADDAQLTVHNLRVAALSNTSPEGSEIVTADDSCSVLPQHSLTHLLVLANNVSLGCIATDNALNSKRLQDLFRVVKVSSLSADLDAATLVKECGRRWESSDGGERRVAITFADYFLSKRPHLADAIARSKLDPRHHLVAMNSISTKVAHRNLLTTMQDDTRELPGWKNRNSVFSNKPERVHFMPEQCRPIGYGHWFYMMKVLPSVVYRVQSVELAVEARNLVFRNARRVCMAEPNLSTQVGMDPQERYVRLLTFLEAMTPKMSLESFDSERLEILGDSFLKFAITVDLFKKRPHNNEGLLTSERVLFISNRRLCAAAIESNLAAYIRALPLSFGPQKICISPPGMCSSELMKARSVWNADVMKYPAEFKYDADLLFRFPVRHHERHMVMFKKLADMVESVIGAFYVDGGKEAGVLALKSFRLWPDATPLPPAASISTPSAVKTEPPPVRIYSENVLKRLSSVPIKVIYSQSSSVTMIDGGEMKGDSTESLPGNILEEAEGSNQCSELSRSTMVDYKEAKYQKFADLENNLGYSFSNKALLLQALTHSSVCSGPNYERLEFLGDAVLDLLLVTHVYRWCGSKLSPDQIHVRKSTATCNHNLAILGCQVQLHRYIVHSSPAVQLQLIEYESKYHSKKLQAKRCKDDADWTEFEREDSMESNVLADTFEAVMGAIFLDAEEDLDTVNRIVTRLGLFVPVVV